MIQLVYVAFIIAGLAHISCSGFQCPNSLGFFDDPNDTAGFYLCIFGYSLHGSCNDSLIFYPKKCVGWNPNQNHQATSKPAPEKHFNCPWVDGKYPDITDISCKGYWICLSQNASYMTCEEGKSFNSILQSCTNDVTCDGYSYKCTETFSYKSDPNDKSKYYECYYGMPYHWTCDPGLVFDSTKNYCNLPSGSNNR